MAGAHRTLRHYRLNVDRNRLAGNVAPGAVRTPLIAGTRSPAQVAEPAVGSLWKRPAQPAALAPAYLFQASTDSRHRTGQVFAPTGMQTTSR